MIKRIFNTLVILFALVGLAVGQETITADRTKGCDSLMVAFSLENALPLSGYTSVVWNFGDGSSESEILTPVHLYSSSGNYTVRCTLDGIKVVEEIEFIQIALTPHADFIFRDSSVSETDYTYYFEASYYQPPDNEHIIYDWEFPDGTVVYDSSALFSFVAEGIYEIFLGVTGETGCRDTLLRKIPVARELMAPNVFSPNGDMINDYFEVTTQGNYSYTLRIFTPSGTQIHCSTSNKIVWDGRTVSGREVPEGVYYYVIESDDTPGGTNLSGFIHLFR